MSSLATPYTIQNMSTALAGDKLKTLGREHAAELPTSVDAVDQDRDADGVSKAQKSPGGQVESKYQQGDE